MFSQASVILSTIGLMATWSLLGLVMVRSVRIPLECFLVNNLTRSTTVLITELDGSNNLHAKSAYTIQE